MQSFKAMRYVCNHGNIDATFKFGRLAISCMRPLHLGNCRSADVYVDPDRNVGRKTLRGYIRHLLARKKPPYKHIVQVGDPVLREKCGAVPRDKIKNDSNQKLIKELVKVMRSRNLMSLSAPQIGVPVQLFVAEHTDKHSTGVQADDKEMIIQNFPLKVLVNPKMEVVDHEICTYAESCYSLQSYCAVVPRFKTVRVTAFDDKGEPVEWLASGMTARIAQHEMDHMEGVLYIDKMKPKTLADLNWSAYNYQGRLFW